MADEKWEVLKELREKSVFCDTLLISNEGSGMWTHSVMVAARIPQLCSYLSCPEGLGLYKIHLDICDFDMETLVDHLYSEGGVPTVFYRQVYHGDNSSGDCTNDLLAELADCEVLACDGCRYLTFACLATSFSSILKDEIRPGLERKYCISTDMGIGTITTELQMMQDSWGFLPTDPIKIVKSDDRDPDLKPVIDIMGEIKLTENQVLGKATYFPCESCSMLMPSKDIAANHEKFHAIVKDEVEETPETVDMEIPQSEHVELNPEGPFSSDDEMGASCFNADEHDDDYEEDHGHADPENETLGDKITEETAVFIKEEDVVSPTPDASTPPTPNASTYNLKTELESKKHGSKKKNVKSGRKKHGRRKKKGQKLKRSAEKCSSDGEVGHVVSNTAIEHIEKSGTDMGRKKRGRQRNVLKRTCKKSRAVALIDSDTEIAENETEADENKLDVAQKKIPRNKKCIICNIVFKNTKEKKLHLATAHKNFDCTICGKKFPKWRNLLTHNLSHRNEPVSCVTCGRMFKTLYNLTVHELTHTDIKPFTCDTCGRSFRHQSTLRRHAAMHISTEPTPYGCEHCGLFFAEETALQVHVKRKHSAKSHVCPEEGCDAAFKTSHELTSHAISHTGEKKHHCYICQKSFKWKSCLWKHDITYHQTGVLACEACGKGFATDASLKTHIQTVHQDHFPFQCEHCQKGYKSRYSLSLHMRNHTGEKPYGCDVCFKRFTLKTSLKDHMQLHVDDTMYACSVCQKTFTTPRYVKRHQRRYHRELFPNKLSDTSLLTRPLDVIQEQNSSGGDKHDKQIQKIEK